MGSLRTAPPPRARGHPKANKTTRYGNGAGQGDGWGGPAKGAGRGSPPLLIPGLDAAKRDRALTRQALKEERTEDLEDLLYDLALNAERTETRITAAVRLHAIYNGSPVARQITASVDDLESMSREELEAELDRLTGTMGEN